MDFFTDKLSRAGAIPAGGQCPYYNEPRHNRTPAACVISYWLGQVGRS